MCGVQQVVRIATDAVRPARLEQQHRAGRILAQTVGEDAAGGPSANDDYVGATGATVADIGHAHALLGSMTERHIVASARVMRHRQIPVITGRSRRSSIDRVWTTRAGLRAVSVT